MKTTKLFAYFTAVTFLLTPSCTYETVDETITVSDGGLKEDAPMPRGYSLSQDMVMDDPAIKTTLNGQSLGAEEADAFQYTVQISIVQDPNQLAANGPPNLRAYVFWNTNGKQKTRWVSVGGGCAITGSAEAVTVQLQDFSGTPADDSGTLADYDVYVAAVPGSRPNSSTGPTLIPLISEAVYSETAPSPNFGGTYTLEPGQTVTVQVPQNVGVQSALISPGVAFSEYPATVDTYSLNAVNLQVIEYDSAGNFIKTYFAGPNDGFLPIGPQVTEVFLTNNGPFITLQGTSDVTSGSAAVVGTGTKYTEQLKVGDYISFNQGTSLIEFALQVDAIADDTHLTLSSTYAGTGGATLKSYLLDATKLLTIGGASIVWGIEG